MLRIVPAALFCLLAGCVTGQGVSLDCEQKESISVSVVTSDPTPLRQAQLDWRKWSCRDHEYELKTGSFGSSRALLVTVKGEKMVAIELISGESLHTVDPDSISIMSILTGISECEVDDACVYKAQFDQNYGIPLHVYQDYPPLEDAYTRIQISRFRFLR